MLKSGKIQYINFVLILLLLATTSSAQSIEHTLKKIWEDEKEINSIRFNALEEYYEINNQVKPDSALISLDYHYKLAKEKNAALELYKATKKKGNIHRLKGNYDIAMSSYQEAESLATKLNDPILKAEIMGNMGNVFVYRQDYKQATRSFSKTLKVYQDLNNSDGESRMLTSLGSVFLIINNYDLALEYYQKSLSIVNKRGFEDRSTAIIYINIGWTNFVKGLYEEAKVYYEKGIKILQVKNEKFFIANCYSTLAKIHLKLNQLDQANEYAKKDLALNTELDIKTGILNAEIIIAQLTFVTNIKDATEKGQSILAKLPAKTNKNLKKDLYELLYKCYKVQNKLDLSLEMYELYNMYNDSIQQEKNNFAVVREAVKNDFEVRLNENKLENENEKAKLRAIQLKRTFAIILTSTLLIISIIFYFKSNIKKNRIKRELLLNELERLKTLSNTQLKLQPQKFELNRDKIEISINRKINETDWTILNILIDDPVISNKETAAKAFKSVDGVGSALRRMYDYFEIKESKYKKISLLMKAIKLSNT